MQRSQDNEPRRKNALGGKPASPLGRVSWAMFDWANQPYFTVVTTVIFAPYFVQVFVGDAVRGQQLYSWTVALSGLAIAVLGPLFGAICDVTGRRKPWMAGLSAVFVIGCFMLWGAVPGKGAYEPYQVMAGLVLAAIAMEIAVVFNHAMLPALVPEDRMGRLSGFAWGLGYFGGIAALLIMMWLFVYPGQVDLPGVPDAPLFGVDRDAGGAERLAGPLAALWYVIFVIPLFLFVPDGKPSGVPMARAIGEGVSGLLATLRKLGSYRNLVRFLIARMIYNDGLSAIFTFGGIYGAAVFGWGSLELGVLGLVMLVFAGVSAMVGGRLDDALGSKRTILLSLCVLIIGTLGVASVGPNHILFFWQTPSADLPGTLKGGLFTSTPERLYLAFGTLLGLGMGPAQSASRTMMARLAPRGMVTEFFGLYALSGKATAFVAPALIGIATAMTGSVRVSVLVILAMLALGLVLLLPVRQERSQAVG